MGAATQLLTVTEVAKMLAVSPRTVQRLSIRFVRVGKLRRYEVRDVERFVTKNASRRAA